MRRKSVFTTAEMWVMRHGESLDIQVHGTFDGEPEIDSVTMDGRTWDGKLTDAEVDEAGHLLAAQWRDDCEAAMPDPDSRWDSRCDR